MELVDFAITCINRAESAINLQANKAEAVRLLRLLADAINKQADEIEKDAKE